MLKAIKMTQVDPPMSLTKNSAGTSTIALMIYGPYTERRLRAMMKSE